MAKAKKASAPDYLSEPRATLPGSEKEAITAAGVPHADGAAKLPPPVPSASRKVISVSVIVPPSKAVPDSAVAGKHLTRAQFKAAHAAHPDAIKAVIAFAKAFGLTAKAEPVRRTVTLTGTVSAMQKAFAVSLNQHTVGGATYRVREGSIQVPQSLLPYVQAVLGLDDRPQAKPHFRIAAANAGEAGMKAGAPTAFTPPQVAALYGYPAGAKATGQTIALIELGGGFRAADITAYFKTLGMPVPTVTAVLVDGGKNSPTNAQGADGEVMLDIEVAAAVAPGAKIAVYFTPNTDKGFVDAITTAAHDTVNKPSVISISWGAPETQWTAAAKTALDNACKAAAALGITVTVAAGDDGSTDGMTDGKNHADFPGTSPNVLCCGGTKLTGSGATITSEVVWNELANKEGATGGGISTFFKQPAYQSGIAATKTGRGVPDVAGDADPVTGYTVRVDGQTFTIGGTSAVAPLWAGLIALSNAQNKNLAGLIQPKLYSATGQKAFHDITSGNNGAYKAGPGWDACTGLGSPIGAKIIALLGGRAAAKKAALKKAALKKSAAKKKAKAA